MDADHQRLGGRGPARRTDTVLSSRVVLGTGPWGRLTSGERRRFMRAAWAIGLRRIDTAPSYGFGAVERDVMRHWPGTVDTKLGLDPRRWHRLAAPAYPVVHRTITRLRSAETSVRGAAASAAPVHALDDAAVARSLARLSAFPPTNLGLVWVHDPPSVDVGRQVRETVLRTLGWSHDRCGVAWTTRPSTLPSGVPLLLPFPGLELDDLDRCPTARANGGRTEASHSTDASSGTTHWHGVIRRHGRSGEGREHLDAYLAGLLRALPVTDRLVIGCYRPDHLDVLHRVAALHHEATYDRLVAARLDDVVREVEAGRS